MNNRNLFFGMLMAAFLGGLLALSGYLLITSEDRNVESFEDKQANYRLSAMLENPDFTVPEGLNFVVAADLVTPGVVHIQSKYRVTKSSSKKPRTEFDDFLKEWFGEGASPYHQRMLPAQSSGSGVIISEDGYIVTNNHVIQNAYEIEVTLYNKKKLIAEVIGTDPTTDLALLKVKADKLPFVRFGESDDVRVGEWVLAVGNPFNLTSTVTAGIVSAKARNINILRDKNNMQIESFIQTDAAVNPGNSGGALVNLKGELIGINTAIATQTGSYTGYSFAVPSALVQKVMDDLKEYGVVQRALLGVNITDLDDPRLASEKFEDKRGVYIANVNPGSAAADAGLKEGDVIKRINGIEVNNVAELQELIARNRPGDRVKVEYLRNGKLAETTATLKNIMGDLEIVMKTEAESLSGAVFAEVSEEDRKKLGIEGGAKIEKLDDGKWKEAGMKEGFIITSIDKEKVLDKEDLLNIMSNVSGGILVEGVYPNGEKVYYGLGW